MIVFDREEYRKGEYVRVRVEDCTSATLLGRAEGRTTLADSLEPAAA
jgi:tRNA-2-methylthio-N6-dimethylallyladenosine synthase